MFELPEAISSKQHEFSLAEGPILIIGAAYTGKSELAQRVMNANATATVIGTGDLEDDDFNKRIQLLKDGRPPLWESIEGQENLLTQLNAATSHTNQIIIDSVNQWLANMTLSLAKKYDPEQLEELLLHEGRQLCGIIREYRDSKRIALVSSEVGAGITPPSSLARVYRQVTSRINCYLAEECRTVIMVSAGIPMVLKGRQLS